MHRLQCLHLALQPQQHDHLHAESDGARGISPRLASRALHAGADSPGSVLVVGAGPAGLECARVLALRGYQVDLCEADETLGGHLRDVVTLPGSRRMGPGHHLSRARS